MRMEDKKKRGCNYTATEKDLLLEIVKKYQHIIENKVTNGNMVLKKREAWESVCQQYNAVAVSGNRTWKQLRHLYENLKQKSKKNLATANRLQFYEKTKELQKKASLDKKEIYRTGGGAYKSTLTGQDNQILAMVAPQIQPLPNPYDDAALYFGDTDSDINKVPSEDAETCAPIIINSCKDYTALADNTVITVLDQEVTVSTDNEQLNTKAQSATCSAGPIKRKPSSETTKQQYFKCKLRNANLEYKYFLNKNKLIMNRNKMERNKYKIEMEILNLRLKKLSSKK